MVIIPISEKFNDYCMTIFSRLKQEDIRVKIDNRNEKMGAKIRTAEIDKIPIMIIIGENEVNDNVISVRRKFKGDLGKLDLNKFIENIKLEISSRNL